MAKKTEIEDTGDDLDLSPEEQEALGGEDDGAEIEAEAPEKPEKAAKAPQKKQPAPKKAEKAEAAPDDGDEDADSDDSEDGDDAKAAEPDPDKPKFVPLKALDAERHKRRDLTAENEQLRTILAKMAAGGRVPGQDEQPQPGQQPQPQQAAQPEPMPDPVLRPAEYEAWVNRRMAENQKPIQQMREQQEAQQRQATAMRQLHDYATEAERTFKAENPTIPYDDALGFARESRRQEYMDVWGMSKDEANQTVQQEEVQLIARAAQQGLSPAAVVYNFAVARGYKPADEDTGEETPAEAVTRLAKTQQRTRSGANARGKGSGELTIDTIAQMSESEVAKLSEEQIAQALGGGRQRGY